MHYTIRRSFIKESETESTESQTQEPTADKNGVAAPPATLPVDEFANDSSDEDEPPSKMRKCLSDVDAISSIVLPAENRPQDPSAESQTPVSSSRPKVSEIKTVQSAVDGRDDFLVLATDGLWEVMSNEQVVTFVSQRLRGILIAPEPLDLLQSCANELVQEALARNSSDNVTVTILYFAPADYNPPKKESSCEETLSFSRRSQSTLCVSSGSGRINPQSDCNEGSSAKDASLPDSK